jgi:DNA mismatch repair ATPase MutS
LELDEKFGDLEKNIELIQTKYIIEIISDILNSESYFNKIDEYLTLIDFNGVLTKIFHDYQLCIPVMTSNFKFQISDSRHLLV